MAVAAGERRTVLVGFADALAGPEVAWSLIDAGWTVIAFSRRGSRPSLVQDRRVGVLDVTPPEDDFEACVGEVAQLVAVHRAIAVLPMDDGAVLVCARAAEIWSRASDTVLVGPTGAQLELALDKRAQLAAASAAGFHLLPEVEAGSLQPSDFPVVLKPALAVQVHDNRLVRESLAFCRDAAELARAQARSLGPTILQRSVAGVGEGLFCLVADGTPVRWSAHRRVRMMNPSGSGASACRSAPVDPELAQTAGRMLTAVGWSGLVMIELLRDATGSIRFMEINGRTWGSMALSRRSGLEYPAWAVDAALGAPVPAGPTQVRTGITRHAGRELVHLLTVLRGTRSATPQPWPTRRRTVRQILSWRPSDSWYNLRPGARRLFVYDTMGTVAKAVRTRRRS